MSTVWVDTDFGFDDLWALLVLRHFEIEVAGVSLVAGNAPLPQVECNAAGAVEAYGLDWPIWSGADRPLVRHPETAQRILGASGMQTRGRALPKSRAGLVRQGALNALRDWLGTGGAKTILALGPLTNIATLLQKAPTVCDKLERIVWMGGSAGAGNHTAQAEFNALSDPEAAADVFASGLRIDVVDLMFCRGVTFGPSDMPVTDSLTADLLGGYLDIALTRGRPGMAIYDPLAALAVAGPETIKFAEHRASVSTDPGESYGATRFEPDPQSSIRLATEARGDLLRRCMDALRMETANGSGP